MCAEGECWEKERAEWGYLDLCSNERAVAALRMSGRTVVES